LLRPIFLPPTIDVTRILADMRRHRESEPESQLSVVNVDRRSGLTRRIDVRLAVKPAMDVAPARGSAMGRALPFAQRSRRLHTDWQLSANSCRSRNTQSRHSNGRFTPEPDGRATRTIRPQRSLVLEASMTGMCSPADDGRPVRENGRFGRRRAAVQDPLCARRPFVRRFGHIRQPNCDLFTHAPDGAKSNS
jgi:hypothetical protein